VETTIKFKMVDTCSIQLGDHFNTMVGNYITIAKVINPDRVILHHDNENHKYIEANQKQYYGLIEALANSNLLKNNSKIVDLGCGLCTTLYNLSLQFLHYNINANFYGIEHNKELIDTFTNYLSPLWTSNKPSLSLEDIMKSDLTNYDLILSYQPLKGDNVRNMYNKISNEMKSGSIFYEHRHKEKECREILNNCMSKNNIEPITLLFGGEKQPLFIKK